MPCIGTEKFLINPGESCTAKLPKNAKVFNMQVRKSQLQIYFEYEKSSFTEERSFYLSYDGDENIPKNFQTHGPIASDLAKKGWGRSLHLYEVF